MAYCPHCGREILEGARFCVNCGAGVASQAAATPNTQTAAMAPIEPPAPPRAPTGAIPVVSMVPAPPYAAMNDDAAARARREAEAAPPPPPESSRPGRRRRVKSRSHAHQQPQPQQAPEPTPQEMSLVEALSQAETYDEGASHGEMHMGPREENGASASPPVAEGAAAAAHADADHSHTGHSHAGQPDDGQSHAGHYETDDSGEPFIVAGTDTPIAHALVSAQTQRENANGHSGKPPVQGSGRGSAPVVTYSAQYGPGPSGYYIQGQLGDSRLNLRMFWRQFGADTLRIVASLGLLITGVFTPWDGLSGGIAHVLVILAAVIAMFAPFVDIIFQPRVLGRSYNPTQLLTYRVLAITPMLAMFIWLIVGEIRAPHSGIGGGAMFLLGGAVLGAGGLRRSADPGLANRWRMVALIALGLVPFWYLAVMLLWIGEARQAAVGTPGVWGVVLLQAVILCVPTVVSAWLMRQALVNLAWAWPAAIAVGGATAVWAVGLRIFTDYFYGGTVLGDSISTAVSTDIGQNGPVATLAIAIGALLAGPVVNIVDGRPPITAIRIARMALVWALLVHVINIVASIISLIILNSSELLGSVSAGTQVWWLVLNSVGAIGAGIAGTMLRRSPRDGRLASVAYAVIVFVAVVLTIALNSSVMAGLDHAALVTGPIVIVLALLSKPVRSAMGPLMNSTLLRGSAATPGGFGPDWQDPAGDGDPSGVMAPVGTRGYGGPPQVGYVEAAQIDGATAEWIGRPWQDGVSGPAEPWQMQFPPPEANRGEPAYTDNPDHEGGYPEDSYPEGEQPETQAMEQGAATEQDWDGESQPLPELDLDTSDDTNGTGPLDGVDEHPHSEVEAGAGQESRPGQ